MSQFPYSADSLRAFAEIEADARALEKAAGEMEASATAIEKLPEGSSAAVAQLRDRARRHRRVIAFLGFMAGRVASIHKLTEPVRRASRFGETR